MVYAEYVSVVMVNRLVAILSYERGKSTALGNMI